MASEPTLNNYYNKGGFNTPQRIGYMMSTIKKAQPLTVDEWKINYFKNVHDKEYVDNICLEMYNYIPESENISLEECTAYVYDVMFRRTFNGYNKEEKTLKYLKSNISSDIEHAPKEWDGEYFIDFYLPATDKHPLIGIQLKPETFYTGNYNNKVDIEGKMAQFREKHSAETYILIYKHTGDGNLVFSNPEVINEIKEAIK